jgi:enoyl-CoA hydratase
MTLFGEVLDAEAAVRAGLALRLVDGGHDRLLEDALALAKAAVEAPRDLVVATKQSMRRTRSLAEHEDAVEVEIVPQLASLESPEFAARLAAMRARINH